MITLYQFFYKNSISSLCIFFLSSCIVVPTYNPHISLTTINENPQVEQLHRVLIVGSGKSPTKIFLDNLSQEMIRNLNNKGVESEFLLIDKLSEPFEIKFQNISANKFDSYLVFESNDDLYLDMAKQKFIAAGPGVYGKGFGNQYSESFKVKLYKQKEKLEILWMGSLQVDFDIVTVSKYTMLSKLIFSELAKNNISFK